MSGGTPTPNSATFSFLEPVGTTIGLLVAAIYLSIFVFGLFNKEFRIHLFRALWRVNRTIFNALASLVGVRVSGETDKSLVYLDEILTAVRDRLVHSPASLSQDAEKEIINLFKSALENEFTSDIRSQIRLLVNQQFQREVEHDAIVFLGEVKSRLQAASSTVTIRGFLNLLIGIGFAGGALYLLREAVEIFSPAQLSSVNLSVVTYLIGIRVSLAILITLISYFFLSLYRKSLDEAKFYQNELTNISAVAAALHLAYYTQNESVKGYVISKLMEYDRNSIGSTEAKSEQDSPFSIDVFKTLLDKIPSLKVT
jgi:hypothetical protein